ncbi:MAG: hypothetical protein AAGK37_03360 [Pseudomonadota bacterium]
MRTLKNQGAWLVAGLLFSGAAYAQTNSIRDQVFDALLADPANEALMFQYAQLSVAERDYEAAVATLERLLDFAPDAQEARYELALAYFALGADEVARYHLDLYRTRGDLTTGERAAADAYIASVDNRESPLTYSGFVEAGIVTRSDPDRVGTAFDLGLELDYALDSPNISSWTTLLRLRANAFPGEPEDNQGIFRIRTGPVVSLDGTAFGARLEPYLEYQIIEDDDDEDSGRSLNLGLEYSQLFASGVTLDAAVERGKIDRKNVAEDSSFNFLRLGATYRPVPDVSLGISGRYLDENYDGDEEDRERYGILMSARKRFDGMFLGMSNWSIRVFFRAEKEEFEGDRNDDINSAGVSVVSYFRPNSYLRTSLRVFDRTSNFAEFDDSDTVFSLEAGMEF